MSIVVKLYSFTKRSNSTKITNAVATDFNCVLKNNCSIINPTIEISANSLIGYNYAFIPDFNRYYFIRDTISIRNNGWEIVLEVDAMASYKNQIGAESHYVLRSSSAYDEYILDTAYIAKVKQTGTQAIGSVDGSNVETDPFSWGNGKHSYVLGVIAKSNNINDQIGSLVYYWLNSTELHAFVNYLMNDASVWSGINTSEYSSAVQAALINPSQYIVSAICLPFEKPSTLGQTFINFGYYSYSIGGNIIIVNHDNMVKIQTVSFNLPKHPQATSRGVYMNNAPYTRYNLHIGPFGNIPIDPASLVDDTGLQVNIRTDICTGMARIWVAGSANSSNKIYTGTCQVGVPINMSQALTDRLAQATNLVNGIIDTSSAALSANVGGAIKADVNALADAERLCYPQVMGGGTAGSFLAFHDDNGCNLEAKFFSTVNENLAEIGRPLCQTRQINSLSGYIKCLNAECQITGTKEEAAIINNYLNEGFFYE